MCPSDPVTEISDSSNGMPTVVEAHPGFFEVAKRVIGRTKRLRMDQRKERVPLLVSRRM